MALSTSLGSPHYPSALLSSPLNSPFYFCYNSAVPVSCYYLSYTPGFLSSFCVPLDFHLLFLLHRKRSCLFSSLCLSLWHSGISAYLVPTPCHLSLEIYALHWVLSIKMPVKNNYAMVFLSLKINACQSVPLTKLHLHPALTFPSSYNSHKTLHPLK